MTPAVGSYSLAGAVLLAGGGMLAAVSAARFDSPRLLRAARAALWALAGVFTLASAALLSAFLGDDFRLAYVTDYSERALPTGYKVAAFWAGQEGSLLLWGWLVAVMAALAGWGRRKDPLAHQAPTVGVLAAACGAFAVLLLFAADPFAFGELIPADGEGMNPMLQDPRMVAHPPLLFVGYAAATVPFALLVGALLSRRRDAAWIASARRWTIVCWLFLTAGIVLGAQWAYVELGWGGYWAWDPVENASLLPWFTATALMHTLMVQQRRGMLRRLNVLLLTATFLLCLLGTYLTRSGVISSVHAFPESRIGWFFLALMAVVLVATVVVAGRRRDLLRSDGRIERLLGREGAFLAAAVLLLIMTATTLVGTVFPLLSRPFTDESVTLEAGFYNTVVIPMGLALMALMALGPLLDQAGRGARRFLPAGVGAALGAVAAALAGGTSAWMLLCAAVAGFAVAAIGGALVVSARARGRTRRQGLPAAVGAVLLAQRRRYAGWLVHLGTIAVMLGVAASSLYEQKRNLSLRPGQSARVGRYTFRMGPLRERRGPNYVAAEAEVTLLRPDGRQDILRPQRRRYDKSEQTNTEVALRGGLLEDIYVTLTGWSENGQVVRIEAIVNPLVGWIWIGGLVMTLAAAVCLLPRRAPARADAEAPAPPREEVNR